MNNVVRVTLQALAAVLGGTQSLHTNSMDEALALPSEAACRWRCAPSRSSPTRPAWPTPADPLAGSYVIEQLTSEIVQRAGEQIALIDEMGGALAAIESGYTSSEIQQAAYAYPARGRKRRAGDRGREQVRDR